MHIAHRTVSSKSKATVFLAALIALFMIPAAPADAASAPGAFAIAGQAQFGQGTGCFSGTALGTHGADPATPGSARATFGSANPNIVIGEGSGELTITTNSGNAVTFYFEWLWVGAAAVLTFTDGHGGAAVAGFAPTLSANVVAPCQPRSGTDSFAVVTLAAVIL